MNSKNKRKKQPSNVSVNSLGLRLKMIHSYTYIHTHVLAPMHTHSSSCDCNNFNIGKIVFARLIYLTIFWFHLWTNKNKNEITFVGAIRWACSLCKLFRFVSIRYVYRIFFYISIWLPLSQYSYDYYLPLHSQFFCFSLRWWFSNVLNFFCCRWNLFLW